MSNVYAATSLTGGAAGALDLIDGTVLADKDSAIGFVQGGGIYFYVLDADSGAAESSPSVISPDANAGTKRWILHDSLTSFGGGYLKLAGGTMTGAIAMGSRKVTGLGAPSTNGDAVRATTKITEANLESAVDLKHAAVTLVAGATSNILSLSTQALSVKTQNANLVLAGPTSGAAAAPTFRALTADDIPSLSGLYLPLSGGTMTGNIVMGNGGTIGQAAGPMLTFDDTNNYLEITGCNVGIGTTTPQVLCHVAGKLACGDSVTSGLAARSFNLISTDTCIRMIRVHDEYGPSLEFISRSTAGVSVHTWDMYTVPATGMFSIRDRTSSDLDRLSITSDGYVGIGTATPFDKLSVYAAAAGDYKGISIKAGDTTANSKIRLQFLANNGVQLSSIEQPSSSAYVLSIINNQNQGIKIQAGASSDANNIIAFLTSGANERMRLTNDGYLGIGMTAVNAALQVNLGLGIGGGSGISATHGARRSLQICTDTNYGGVYDNYGGFLLCSTMDTGWGYAQLHFCHSDNWGSYDTANPVMTLAGTGIKLNDHLLIQPILKDYGEAVNALGNLTGAKTVDLTLGNVVTGTTTGDTTWTFSNPTATGNACSFTLILTNGGSKTQTWPASVDWPGGTAPTLTSSGVDVLTFVTINAGTIWMGSLTLKDVK